QSRISVEAYNQAFPKYPIAVEDKGWIYGLWYCGTSWNKVRLHGEYAPTFLERALSLFPDAKDIVHCPSGTVLGPGLTIDRIRDNVRCPQIVADAGALPIRSSSADLILSDPPYTEADSKICGCKRFPMRNFMKEAHRVLRPAGHLAILHTLLPGHRKHEWKLR